MSDVSVIIIGVTIFRSKCIRKLNLWNSNSQITKIIAFFPSEYYFSLGLLTIKIFFMNISDVNKCLTYYLYALLIKSSDFLKDHLTVLQFELGLIYQFP